MKAMVITSFGGPEVFDEREILKPKPGPNELLVRVYASSINPVDYKVRQSGQWAGIVPPATIGYDVAGVVEDIGSEVRDFKPGDEVYYTPEISSRPGSYAEFHVVNEAIVARKPSNLTFEEAAAVPLAGGTAYDAIITRGHLHLGETVLIHGGAGGTGHFAVQLAKAAGAFIYTTCGPYNIDFVTKLGADRPIDYRSQDFIEVIRDETDGRGVDLVFDTVGNDTVAKSIDATAKYGRIVTIVNMTGNLNKAYRKNITIESLFLERARYKLDALRNLIERGQIKPHIDSILPLKDVAKGHEKLERGGVRGKIVLRVSEE